MIKTLPEGPASYNNWSGFKHAVKTLNWGICSSEGGRGESLLQVIKHTD